MSVRTAAALFLLLAQVMMIVFARFHPMRYYCWAPYDSQNEYEIQTELDGRSLSRDELEERYRLAPTAVNPRAISQVTDVVSYVERVYHPDERARVIITYRTNGGPEQVWTWPQS